MHSLIRLFSLGFFALVVVNNTNASATLPVVAYRPGSVGGIANSERLQIGSRRSVVLLVMGDPDVRAGDDYWVFWGMRAWPADANPQCFDALVVSFTGDVVSGMKLVDAQAIRRRLSRRKPSAD